MMKAATGILAPAVITDKVPVRNVDYSKLKQRLLAGNQRL